MQSQFSDIKKLQCPTCDEHFTDFSIMWTQAWIEGYQDCSTEFSVGYAKDGPIKTCCELCDSRWEYNYFSGKVIPYKPDQSNI